MDAIQFDQLPHLCLKKIFSFLNLRDLMTCKKVNRQFKAYAKESAVNELVVRDPSTCCSKWCKYWYQTLRRMDDGNSISPRAFASRKLSTLKLSDQLKFLHIHPKYQNSQDHFNFKLLNSFKQLLHLELRIWITKDRRETLILPNLKILDVRLSARRTSFVLKTPKLEVLACHEISRIQAEHPETIKQINCEYRGENDLPLFKNLQVLVCQCHTGDLNGILLSNWKGLKELQIRLKSVYGGHGVAIEEFRSSMFDLLRQRTESKREELKLYLEDVLLLDAKQLESYGTSRRSRAAMNFLFWIKNFSLLRCPFLLRLTSVNFNELNAELPSDFFHRCPHIQELTATGPVERDRFEWFLQNATAVRELKLTNTSLDQTFMDRLPKINSQLISFKLKKSSRLVTNLNFILQFEQLKIFETDREFGSLDLAAKAFEKLKEFRNFHFRSTGKLVTINRPSSTKNDYVLIIDTFYRTGVRWTKLVALYNQRTAAPTDGGKQAAKTKRARLQ